MPTTLNKAGHSTNDLASGGLAVTPTDAANLSSIAYGLYVGTGGDISVVTVDDSALTFKNCNTGSFLPVIIKKVLSTGTTASNIIALY